MDGFAAGVALGFGSGIAPGPLFALVIATTLRRGAAAGAQVAASPLLSDLPIVVLSVTVLGALDPRVLAGLGLVGSLVVLGFAVESFRAAGTATLSDAAGEPPAAGLAPLRRGALVNLLNPAPWLFWATIGGPILISGWRTEPAAALAWLAGFYLALVGSKVALAAAVAAGRHRLTTRGYRRLLVFAGLLLVAVALLLAREALAGLLSA